jgi:hypothetical protein
MNKIDWVFWGIIVLLAACLLVGIFVSGCAILQPKPKPVIPIKTLVKPTVQLWYAAKASNWLVTMSILGIAGGVFATLNGQKWGLAVVVSCSVSLFMSLAVARFAWWMAVCGLFGSVGICITSILSRKRALVQIIKGGEILKKNDAAYGIVSAKAAFNNAQAEAQKSKSTQKIVQKIKSDLKIKGEIE